MFVRDLGFEPVRSGLLLAGRFEFRFLAGDAFFLALDQFLGGLAPRAEMVFIKHHQIPLHFMNPLVLGLDVARGLVAAQQILQ